MNYRVVIILLFLSFYFVPVEAQVKSPGHSVSAGIIFPVHNFSRTHFIGAAAGYAPTLHRFGVAGKKKFDFTYCGGGDFYFGRKETVSGYPYRYRNYLFVYGFGGLLFQPQKMISFQLYAGPALGIYHGSARFTIGSRLDLDYYINQKFGISPGLSMMKETGADPLWSFALKGIMAFR